MGIDTSIDRNININKNKNNPIFIKKPIKRYFNTDRIRFIIWFFHAESRE
jgi:hypothetical protein